MFDNKEKLKEAINLYCSDKNKCIELHGEPNTWDVSNVTDMSNMFQDSKFKGDVGGWDVSNVTNMYGMFYKSKFNGDISKWDVSKVVDMRYMFSCSKFNGDISSWDVSNVEDMSGMFYRSKFNGDISRWDVSCVTDMSYMFGNSKFKRKICNWDVSNVVNMRGMFLNLTECYTHRWDISSLVYGKEEIIKLGAKIPEIKKMVQLIEEGYEECPVTREVIEGDYFKCSTCKHCFDMEVEKWIDENKQCPYCRSKWGKKIMYSQS